MFRDDRAALLSRVRSLTNELELERRHRAGAEAAPVEAGAEQKRQGAPWQPLIVLLPLVLSIPILAVQTIRAREAHAVAALHAAAAEVAQLESRREAIAHSQCFARLINARAELTRASRRAGRYDGARWRPPLRVTTTRVEVK